MKVLTLVTIFLALFLTPACSDEQPDDLRSSEETAEKVDIVGDTVGFHVALYKGDCDSNDDCKKGECRNKKNGKLESRGNPQPGGEVCVKDKQDWDYRYGLGKKGDKYGNTADYTRRNGEYIIISGSRKNWIGRAGTLTAAIDACENDPKCKRIIRVVKEYNIKEGDKVYTYKRGFHCFRGSGNFSETTAPSLKAKAGPYWRK